MKHKAFIVDEEEITFGKQISRSLSWVTLESIYPRYPQVDELNVVDFDRLSIFLYTYIIYSK